MVNEGGGGRKGGWGKCRAEVVSPRESRQAERMEPPTPEQSRQAALQVVERLVANGHRALWAGGCVRDERMGRCPKDYDVATSALPDQTRSLFAKRVEVGAQFGVIVVLDFGPPIEVATFRTDGSYRDGRRPDAVTFSSAEEDAQRRDFTVNGLFYDPLQEKLIDYVGGQADLEARILRAIGDPVSRFREDKLRLMRAVRFAAELDFPVEPATWEAVRAMAPEIGAVSPERIRQELVRTLLCPNRVRGFDLLDESGLMREILPEIEPMKGCDQPPEFHPEGDVYVHTRLMLSLLPERVSLPLVFGVLFHDVAKPVTRTIDETGRIRFNGHDRIGAEMAEAIMTRLRFSRAEIDATVEIVRQHMVFKDVRQMRVAKLKRFMSRPTFEDELELHRVDCTSSHGMLDNYDFLQRKEEEFAGEPLIPKPLITGKDLLALGWKPGPALGEMLAEVQTAQLEGRLKSREEALDWVREPGEEKS